MPTDRGGGNGTVPRRTILGSLVGSTLGLFSVANDWTATGSTGPTADALVDEVMVHSSCSLLAPGKQPLDDDSVVLRAGSSAVNIDSEAGGDFEAVPYEDTPIPLAAIDDRVAGIGSTELVNDDNGGFRFGTEEFVLNLFDEMIDGDRVLWDESHDQFHTLSKYGVFQRYAQRHGGYTLEATGNLTGIVDVEELRFSSSASQIAPDGGPLTDSELILARAPETATNVDDQDDGAYIYESDEDIPLATVDGNVVGVGTPELFADGGSTAATRQFGLNTIEHYVEADSDGATILWDESHDQFYGLDSAGTFAEKVRAAGHEITATTSLLGGGEEDSQPTLDDADALIVTSPSRAFTEAELDALQSFVINDGVVVLCDQSEFKDFDETEHLNEIADGLDLGFRFNPDEVKLDGVSDFRTDRLATEQYSSFFESGESLDPSLDEAAALVVTSPSRPFSEVERAALDSFVEDGGALLLFSQSDFDGYDEATNLNELAEALDLSFRFNSDQVIDTERNAGPDYRPLTSRYAAGYEFLFEKRSESVGFSLDPAEQYTAQVVRVSDGDTVQLEFDGQYGYRRTVRVLGVDTPETGGTPNSPREWTGLGTDDLDHIATWGEKATDAALEKLADGDVAAGEEIDGRSVTLSFDAEETDDIGGITGEYGRLLGYLHYDLSSDSGVSGDEVLYNKQLIEEGYARVYSSGFSRHDEFAELQEQAYDEERGIWSEADLESLSEVRNESVEELFVPAPRAITSTHGDLADGRVPITTEDSATRVSGAQTTDSGNFPLAAVDERAGVIVLSGVLISEDYEKGEDYPVDTSSYDNFPFLTNLIDDVTETSGDVIIEAGHGQFGAEGAISLEDAKFYRRYLEGVGIRCRQINDLAERLPEEPEPPRAIIITSPAESYTTAERQVLRRYLARGGTVVLAGSANAPDEHAKRLDKLAAALNSDLRFGDDHLIDETNNVNDDPAVVTTSAFDRTFPVFDSYTKRSPAIATYLETIANDEGIIDDEARAGAVQDWAAGRIDRDQLEAVIEAHESGQPVGGGSQ
jgi:endonuclease YncB( thermonuclease family)